MGAGAVFAKGVGVAAAGALGTARGGIATPAISSAGPAGAGVGVGAGGGSAKVSCAASGAAGADAAVDMPRARAPTRPALARAAGREGGRIMALDGCGSLAVARLVG
jgi:uncharacterized metal-binding protein